MDRPADNVLIPLRKRLQDWTEWDEAAFFLGRLLGVLPEHYSVGQAKAFVYGQKPGHPGRNLVLLLNLMADLGILDTRNNYLEFRWPVSVE